jgi:hypothetical protein
MVMNTRTAGTEYAKAAITARSRHEALAKLKHEQRAGRIAAAGKLTLITTGHHAGEYAIPVLLLPRPRPAHPAWIRPVLVLGVVLLGVAAFGSVALWLVTTLTAAPLLVLMGMSVLGLGRLVHLVARPRRATVTTSTTITWR